MRPQWRRYAPLGLYVSLIAALVSAALYIIQREWNLYLQISLGMVVIGLALFSLLDPERVRVGLTGRQARYGSNALVLSLAFIGILVVINYLGYKNSTRWDLTEDKVNTLSPETLEVLKSLPEPVEALAFFTPRLSTETARRTLESYHFAGGEKFTYRFIDPEEDLVLAREAQISRDGTIVLRSGSRQEPVEFVTEREITAALIRLMSDEVRAVYFLTGHGERSIETAGEGSITQAKQILESKNYKVETTNLIASSAIPTDASVIVIAGPIQPITSEEVQLLDGYLKNGGALIVMAEPSLVTEFGEANDPLADYLEQSYGVSLGKDIVIDLSSNQPYVAVVSRYGNHAITEKLPGLVSLLPSARSVTLANQVEQFNPIEIAFTSENAWAESDLEGIRNQSQEIGPDENIEKVGNVPLVVAGEGANSNERIAVFGDSDFASDTYFTVYANGDLFINTVDWAAEQENLINLTPRETTSRVLVPPQRYTMGLILFGSVFFLPGVVLLAGVVVWFQKRKRG